VFSFFMICSKSSFCEHSDERLGSMKAGNFFCAVSLCELLYEESDPWTTY
jgi:hypothetical protein